MLVSHTHSHTHTLTHSHTNTHTHTHTHTNWLPAFSHYAPAASPLLSRLSSAVVAVVAVVVAVVVVVVESDFRSGSGFALPRPTGTAAPYCEPSKLGKKQNKTNSVKSSSTSTCMRLYLMKLGFSVRISTLNPVNYAKIERSPIKTASIIIGPSICSSFSAGCSF